MIRALAVVGVFLLAAFSASAEDWTASSIIENSPDQKSLVETIYLVNTSSKTITLSFPNFQFYGHANKPAESVGPMGALTVGPGEAIRFLHTFPLDEKDGFNDSMGIQDVRENIPVKRLMIDNPDMRPKVKATFGAAASS